MDIGSCQLGILYKAKQYLAKVTSISSVDRASILLYLISWDPKSTGNAQLKIIVDKWKFLFLFVSSFLKNIISIRVYSNLQLHSNYAEEKAEYRTLIISWCKISDFDKDGQYHDRYFNCTSSDSDEVLWLLISIDDQVPVVMHPNVRVFSKMSYGFLKGIFFVIGTVWDKLRQNKWNLWLTKYAISAETVFAKKISGIAENLYNTYGFKTVLQPYEAQPYQHEVYIKLRQCNSSIYTAGYLHSALPPLPTDLIYRPGAPDVVYVHGKGQINIMNKLLNWDMSHLDMVQSLRYRTDTNDSFSGWIFLPYNFSDSNKIINALENYYESATENSFPVLAVRCHPAKYRSRKHLSLIEQIESLIKKFASRFDVNCRRKVSIFIGATASIIESLERGVEVIHITSDPVFESHQSDIWEDIQVELINENTFEYRLINPGSYICLGSNKDSFIKMTS